MSDTKEFCSSIKVLGSSMFNKDTSIHLLEQKNKQLEQHLADAKNILRDFLTTKECRATWIEEMHGTISAFLKENGSADTDKDT